MATPHVRVAKVAFFAASHPPPSDWILAVSRAAVGHRPYFPHLPGLRESDFLCTSRFRQLQGQNCPRGGGAASGPLL
eukprot:15430700-Alexandrium_andersonii.AAC.1